MRPNTKKISRITRLMEQQKEAMEMEVLQARNRLAAEEGHLADLKNELSRTLDDFEERVQSGERIALHEVSFLFEMHKFLSSGIKKKRNEVSRLEGELELLKQVLLEAYQRKEVFGVFQNKMIRQELRGAALNEQKSLDYLNLNNGIRKGYRP
jgi:flagellar export protein FliJ